MVTVVVLDSRSEVEDGQQGEAPLVGHGTAPGMERVAATRGVDDRDIAVHGLTTDVVERGAEESGAFCRDEGKNAKLETLLLF